MEVLAEAELDCPNFSHSIDIFYHWKDEKLIFVDSEYIYGFDFKVTQCVTILIVRLKNACSTFLTSNLNRKFLQDLCILRKAVNSSFLLGIALSESMIW
jgi:hypothetical protein